MTDDNLPNWEGRNGTPNEHRTVGSHRARCFECNMWCYADADGDGSLLCTCCQKVRIGGDTTLVELDELYKQQCEENTALKEQLETLKKQKHTLQTQVVTWRTSILIMLRKTDPDTAMRMCAWLREHNPNADWSWLPQ